MFERNYLALFTSILYSYKTTSFSLAYTYIPNYLKLKTKEYFFLVGWYIVICKFSKKMADESIGTMEAKRAARRRNILQNSESRMNRLLGKIDKDG